MRSSGERLSGYGVVYEPSMVSHKGFSLMGSQHEDANVNVDTLYVVVRRLSHTGARGTQLTRQESISWLDLSNGCEK